METFEVLNVGAPVSLIWYSGGEPQSLIATVSSDSPLTVEVAETQARWVTPGTQFKVLFQNEGVFETADAEVKSVSPFNGKLRFELFKVEWVKSDRRSHTRYPATLLAKCRFVSEEGTEVHIREFTVTTRDISFGGAWVDSDAPVNPGTILNCEISTGPESTVRVLSVVAWADPNGRGYGIEFLDFIGTGRQTLTGFIESLAA